MFEKDWVSVKIEQHSLEIEQRLREQQLEQEKQNACGHKEKEHQEQKEGR